MTIKGDLLSKITEYYFKSGDFNGLPISALELPSRSLKSAVRALLREGKISINFGDRHPNPHIKAFEPEPIEDQQAKLTRFGISDACLYPSVSHLELVVQASSYEGQPFTLRLARGEPQLKFLSFDLRVLETYRNDPRYRYDNDDIQGSVSVSDSYYESAEMRDSDQVILQTFGFAYSKEMKRAVAVYLRYLADLSPEHQQIWNAHLLTEDYKLHPDYFRSTILGEWYDGVSIFDAFLEELHQINEMSALMGRAHLFKKSFHEDRPKNFGFLIRPTHREFNDFVHLLDKLLSENIDRKFFKGDQLTFETDKPGTLLILETWINSRLRLEDPTPKDEMFATLKKIRRLRQRPAHAVVEDRFDQHYFQEQRDLIIEAYDAIRTLRQMFALHRAVKEHSVPDWLDLASIRTY